MTEQYCKSGHLDFAELLEDGFRDLGPESTAFRTAETEADVADAAAVGATVVIVDRREDTYLAEWMEKISKKLLRGNDVVTRVMVAALLVSEAFGRSGHHASNLQTRLERLTLERSEPAMGVVKLGDLMHDFAAPGGSKGRQPGAGLDRHRALLFKLLADLLHVVPCSLHRDEEGACWNILIIDGEPFVLDVMFDPGALYTEGSGKASEYLRRLRHPEETALVGAGAGIVGAGGRKHDNTPAAPSVQQNLGGRMVRPSWHVEPWEIEFDRRDRAGRGGFGEVFQGTWAGQPAAVKEVRDANPTDGDVCDFILEISLLSRLSHPNVIRFWRGCVDLRTGHRTLFLVTEWSDRGVLSSLLHESQEPNLTIGQMQVLAVGIGLGVAYLHDVKILHLDLKSPNVLLNSSWHPKLCDFGLAKLREQTALHTTLRGVSPIWAPPEMFDDKAGGLTEKADVYSFGIIIFELATRKLPYSDVSQMQLPRVKLKGQLPKFPEDIDADLAELTKACLVQKPAGRPAMQAVIVKVEQMAKSRGIDLQEEQSKMEKRGLHFGGMGGSTPNAEQLRRAEAEKRRAELEVARLRKVLQDEEARVRLLEADVARRGGRGATLGGSPAGSEEALQKKIQEFCETQTQAVGEAKFRCVLCRKLFRGPEFVHKHVREKHLDEMHIAQQPQSPADAAAGHGAEDPTSPANKGADKFFDTDIAEESNARIYTNTIAARDTLSGGCRFNQALQDAAQAGDLSKVQQCLLQGGSSLNQADIDGITPLHLSAKFGHADCLQYLISNAGDLATVDESGLTALHWAAQEGHGASVQLLLEAGSAVDADGSAKKRAPLHLAAANGQKEVCGILLIYKASVNLQDAEGESPLHSAARFGDRELCEVILSFGATVNVTDNDGWSPLHEAARWGDGGIVESLLQRGAEVGARSNDGESALHVVPGGYAECEVVEVLLNWRCDVNCKDYDGEAPLHVAVKLGDAELASVFLNSGADPNITNLTGATPLDFAKSDELRWLLRSFKARKGTGA